MHMCAIFCHIYIPISVSFLIICGIDITGIYSIHLHIFYILDNEIPNK